MAQIRSAIVFTGNEKPRELAQKLMDLQRQIDSRVSETEKTVAEHEVRISEIE